MALTQWSPAQLIKQYAIILARKMGFIALGWVVVYFVSQPMRWEPDDGGVNILTLFGLLVGAFAGLVAGWYMATEAVEESSMHGLMLWAVLVVATALPMWLTEAILRLFTHWSVNFGGFMILSAATIMGLAASVWHASSQE